MAIHVPNCTDSFFAHAAQWGRSALGARYGWGSTSDLYPEFTNGWMHFFNFDLQAIFSKTDLGCFFVYCTRPIIFVCRDCHYKQCCATRFWIVGLSTLYVWIDMRTSIYGEAPKQNVVAVFDVFYRCRWRYRA